jgi:hypothetical protein
MKNDSPPPKSATPRSDRRKFRHERQQKKQEQQAHFPFWTDPVTLSEEADQPELNLLGENGFLRREGGMLIVGPTEVGKSSLATQLAIEWGCNHPHAIIKSANGLPLRVLMVQSEDDRQDSREMARCIKFLNLTPEQKARVKKNVHFAQWKAHEQTRRVEGENGEEETRTISAIEGLLEVIEKKIQEFGPVDIIIVNPLSAYTEEGVLSQKANQRLLYGLVNPFLKKHECGIIFIHHPPKVREGDKRTIYAPVYAAAGDATLANWPRANLFIWPQDEKTKLFEFKPEKRANRLGWGEASRFYKWSQEGIFWERADSEEVRYVTQSEKSQPVPEDLLRLIPPFVTDLGKGPKYISRALLYQKGQTNTPRISKHNFEVFLKILKEQEEIDWMEIREDPREKRGSRHFFRTKPGLF